MLKNKILNLFIIIFLLVSALSGCSNNDLLTDNTQYNQNSETSDENAEVIEDQVETDNSEDDTDIKEDGLYTNPYDVARYLNTYNKLPSNFITKKEAAELGWESEKGNLWEVTDEMSIGGDYFGNREGLLPKKDGRKWFECDVNYSGGYRGAERIVFSNDGLIYYTDDHYDSFTQLY